MDDATAERTRLLQKEQGHLRRGKEEASAANDFYKLALRGLTPFVMVAVFTVFLIAFGGKDKPADEYDVETQKVLDQIDPMFSPIANGKDVKMFQNPKFPDLFADKQASSKEMNAPNFVFVLADDLGYNSLSPEVSPFLSSLQEGSITLTNYYAQEVCTPSRMAFLTGRHPLTLGWQYGAQEASESGGLGLDETTLAEVLQLQGYTTFMMGKWNAGNASPRYVNTVNTAHAVKADQRHSVPHTPMRLPFLISYLPTARGFDYYFGYLDGYNNYWSKLRPQSPQFRDFMYSDSQCYYQYDTEDVESYSTNLYGDAAVQVRR